MFAWRKDTLIKSQLAVRSFCVAVHRAGVVKENQFYAHIDKYSRMNLIGPPRILEWGK